MDFSDTAVAFAWKTDRELLRAYRLFALINHRALVNAATRLTPLALRLGLPVQGAIRATLFSLFCGGRDLQEAAAVIQRLAEHGVLTALDYGAEGKPTEPARDRTRDEFLRLVAFAADRAAVPVVSCKVSSLARPALLERIGEGQALSAAEQQEHDAALQRLQDICARACAAGVGVFLDAEQSWVQGAIDAMAREMMRRHNRQRVTVYQTYQLYRTDALAALQADLRDARQQGYLLGAKLVRGAYMERERERARRRGQPSPVHATKQDTDRDFDAAVALCVEHHLQVGSCVATHNEQSCALQARLMAQRGIPSGHPHLLFCQLYGMSDHVTFQLARRGYNAAKYMPYGSVAEVVPYLLRRARENSSLAGEVSRELRMLRAEVRRRGLRGG